MSNLTKRHSRQHIYTCLGLLTAFIALVSACSNTESTPNSSMAGSGGQSGGSAGMSGGGGKAGGASAGSTNQAGSGGSGGSAAGTAGNAGSGGSAGGMPCAADDECCDDPNKTEPGECGCGIPDVDSDTDGELNCNEECPNDPNKTEPGMCLCGNAENDSDDDGVIDCKPGHFYEAEDGVFSTVDVPIVPNDGGEGGAGGGGSGGAGMGGASEGSGGDASFDTAWTTGEDAKASGMEYIQSPSGFTSDSGPGPARAEYDIEITTAGMYRFWVRVYTPTLDHNRIWVKIDDGTWTKLRITSGETWFWYSFHVEGMFDVPIQYTLTAGAHKLYVASNSDEVKVDRFYVSPSADRPPGDDTTCNPPHTIPQDGVCKSSCGMLTGDSCDAVLCVGKVQFDAYDCDVCCKL
jgi:hypothetical protein